MFSSHFQVWLGLPSASTSMHIFSLAEFDVLYRATSSSEWRSEKILWAPTQICWIAIAIPCQSHLSERHYAMIVRYGPIIRNHVEILEKLSLWTTTIKLSAMGTSQGRLQGCTPVWSVRKASCGRLLQAHLWRLGNPWPSNAFIHEGVLVAMIARNMCDQQ